MKKMLTTIVVIFVIFIGVLVAGPFYTINEGEQAVIVRFGRITDKVEDAGLKLKVPFIDEVVRYPKKIIAWDGEARIMPTAERQFIYVDVTARFRISDPIKFYESMITLDAAYSKLAEIIDSEVRTVVAENPLRESVLNSSANIERALEAEVLGIGDIDIELIQSTQTDSTYEKIEKGRLKLAEEMLTRSKVMVQEYGIELIDVVTRQISYSPELTPSVYARMIRERNQIAMWYRSEGEGRKAEWLGKMDNEKRSILSQAYSEAETIRGRADAQATSIYANAYSRDRPFFEFWRAIESYRQTMPKFDKTLTTDMEYFRYLYSPNPR